MRFFHCRRCHWKDGNPDRCFSSSFRCNRYDSGNTGATADAVEGEAAGAASNLATGATTTANIGASASATTGVPLAG